MTGPVHLYCMDKGQSINADSYIKNCLEPLVAAIHEQRPKSGTKSDKLHHGNAKSHVTKVVKKYLEDVGVRIIRHPSYSPDLAPCDHWLFDLIKRHLTDAIDEKGIESQITEACFMVHLFPSNSGFNACIPVQGITVINNHETFRKPILDLNMGWECFWL